MHLTSCNIGPLASVHQRRLRANDTELVSFGIGQHIPGLLSRLPDVDPACPDVEQSLDLGVPIVGGSCQVEVNAILGRL